MCLCSMYDGGGVGGRVGGGGVGFFFVVLWLRLWFIFMILMWVIFIMVRD